MPPKKPPQQDKKGGAQQLLDEDYSDLPTLPPINNYIFTAFYAFKYKKNFSQLQQYLLQQFQFSPEDAMSQRNKVIQKEDLINHAKLKQYLTEEEGNDISKVSNDKLTEIFAKVTNELILSIEVPLRRQKKEAGNLEPSKEVDIVIWLKDFPQTINQFQALFNLKQNIQGIYVIEEQFQKDEEDDIPKLSIPDPTLIDQIDEETLRKHQEKLQNEFTKEQRIQIFETILKVNKIVKSSPLDSDMRLSYLSKLKFQGPDPPALSKEEQEDEFRRDKELKQYEDFSKQFKQDVEQTSKDLQEYRILKTNVKTRPLMPYPEDPLSKQREEEERLREEKRKQEEERKAQELLLQQQQQMAQAKGKGAAPVKQVAQTVNTKSKENLRGESAMSARGDEQKKKDGENKKKAQPRSKDDEEKDWTFQHLEKILAELQPGQTNIGSLLAAMIYEIDQHNKKEQPDKRFILKQEEQENKLQEYFEDAFNKLSIEHNLAEASFNHQLNQQVIQKSMQTSPYQSLFNENDRVSQISQSYTFLNGDGINKNESQALQNCKFPGINQRQGMPAVPSIQQAQRESDLSAILQYSPLPASQTKRSLILRAFEELMKKQQPERDFFFLDRKYFEKCNSLTFRQELATAFQKNSDIAYQYYEREDALLLALFFKNPPGRLLRRQWSYPIKVFPDFMTWKKFVKQENLHLEEASLEIESTKVGLIRTNSKYCFPADNSMIRIDKHFIGNRRIGASFILKDNFIFGIRENPEKFKQKVGGEEELINVETFQNQDRRCDFWLHFENGLKFLVEMAEHQEPHIEEIPLQEPLSLYEEEKQIEVLTPTKVEEKQEQQHEQSKPLGKDTTLAKNASQSSLKNQQQQQQQKAGQQQQQKPPQQQVPPPQATLPKSESQTSLHEQQQQLKKEEEINKEVEARLKSPLNKPIIHQDNYDQTKGAKLTFTFEEGLIVQILPKGDVCQTNICNSQEKKKLGGTIQDTKNPSQNEKSRLITRNGEVIITYHDQNMVIYYPDGTITTTDKRKGVWLTTNSLGVKRVRKLKDNLVYDEPKRVKIQEKIDPETNAQIQIREDGVLVIKYVDGRRLVQMPDGTQILTRKEGEQGTVIIVTKEGFAPIRQIFDPVKERAKTVIGLGGTDSLMGADNLMERSNNGRITEVLLPDKTIVQSYLERQELEGYNNFCTNMVHLVRRDDFSVIKVKQDGEIVLISANARGYLNDIGKQKQFGINDYDFFFELFGVPNERRSGVYTANIDQGKIWTSDEEGNVFIVYANGNSVEKLSVSFNLDQMVEGLENKEPSSPRMQDGEYIEEECKFLPPSKTIDHPRLFMIKNDVAFEYYNREQLEYFFRCREKDNELLKSQNNIKVENEDAISHMFLRKSKRFDAQILLKDAEMPKIPICVELVNQTVSVPKEPIKEEFLWRNIIEFKKLSRDDINDFNNALQRYTDLRQRQKDEKQRLKVDEIKTDDHKQMECKIWLRIAKERGIDVSQVIGEEYKPLKEIVNEEKKQKFLDNLENTFFDDEE